MSPTMYIAASMTTSRWIIVKVVMPAMAVTCAPMVLITISRERRNWTFQPTTFSSKKQMLNRVKLAMILMPGLIGKVSPKPRGKGAGKTCSTSRSQTACTKRKAIKKVEVALIRRKAQARMRGSVLPVRLESSPPRIMKPKSMPAMVWLVSKSSVDIRGAMGYGATSCTTAFEFVQPSFTAPICLSCQTRQGPAPTGVAAPFWVLTMMP
mmetsp:Transcript_45040/g.127521  ORF Transcript_45040/g.127521 Transcript_45040/m.127521 type:complete len:209 (-) Transcript_45040:149-775(-)